MRGLAEKIYHVPSIPPSLPSVFLQFLSTVGCTGEKPVGTFKVGKIPAAYFSLMGASIPNELCSSVF